ncbi:MAG: hypothetical protein MUF54_19770, partial [Polyangiaceae bacterium]|nr:hypothetical protein [Polyangiaceae bacterium]
MHPLPRPPNNLLIGVDVDGVLADLVGPLLDQLHQRSGVRVLRAQIVSFDLALTLGPLWPAAHDILLAPGFASSLPVTPGAVDAVQQLRELGRVVFVTTPMPRS